MKTIDLFEKRVKKLSRDITPEEFAELLKDEKLKEEFFSNPVTFLEIITEISNRTVDVEFRKILEMFKITLTLQNTENDILKTFFSYSSGDLEREELLNTIKEKINDNDPIVSLSYALCSLTSIEDLELDSDAISKSAKSVLGYFDNMTDNLVVSYSTRIDLLDLLTHVRAKYFRYYQKDILDTDDVEKLRKLLRELHSFEDEIMLARAKEIYPESEELPEELGLIDITKLHKDKEE